MTNVITPKRPDTADAMLLISALEAQLEPLNRFYEKWIG